MRLFALPLLAALVAAGCASPAAEVGPDAAAPEADASAAAEPLLQSGCSSYYSTHRVDRSFAQARLPEGLAPYAYDLGGAMFTLKAWTCPSASVPGAAAAAYVYYLAVEPEPAFDADHVGFSWYPLEIVTSTEELAEAFRGWGFGVVRAGEVAIDRLADDPRVVRVAGEGAAAVAAEITVPQLGSEDGSFTVRYFAGADRVEGAVDIVVHPGARGGGGATLLRLDGEHAPSPVPMPGRSSFQGWGADELSYTWTGVRFDG